MATATGGAGETAVSVASVGAACHVGLARLGFSGAVVAVALLMGQLLAREPSLAVAGAVALVLALAAFFHPPFAVYVLLATTPLVVGMNRDAVFPVLRPNEAVMLLVGGAVLTRRLAGVVGGTPVRRRLPTTDASVLLLVVTGSVVPLLWLFVRGVAVTQDDLLYAVALWKYYGIYLLVRTSIHTEEQVQRCLLLSMGAGAVVAVVGILQALDLFGVPRLLATHYAPYGDTGALYNSRGTSTLAHAQAMADVMVFNLAIALGMLALGKRWRLVLVGAVLLFVSGSLASGQFSGAIALVVGLGAVGLADGRLPRVVLGSLAAVVLAAVAMQPVIDRRLRDFSSGEGLPPSWVARLDNLRTHFWPKLSTDFNYVLGVRPAARLPSGGPGQFVFIESGHTWLLWIGGVPFLAAFVVFLWTNMRAVARIARRRADAVGVAAGASFAGLAVVAVLMVFDPHLTLRGSADLNFALLALAYTASRKESRPGRAVSSPTEGPSTLAVHTARQPAHAA